MRLKGNSLFLFLPNPKPRGVERAYRTLQLRQVGAIAHLHSVYVGTGLIGI